MAVRNKSVKQQIKTLEPIKYGPDELHVSYFVNAYTPRLEEEAETQAKTAGGTLINMVLPLIAEWDLTDVYPVFQYEKCGYAVDSQKFLDNVNKRLFVVNGEGGKIGEFQMFVVRDEFAGGEKTQHVYELVPVFRDGEQATEEKAVPVTIQGLMDVPLNVLTDIVKAVGEALSPGEGKSSNSESSFG